MGVRFAGTPRVTNCVGGFLDADIRCCRSCRTGMSAPTVATGRKPDMTRTANSVENDPQRTLGQAPFRLVAVKASIVPRAPHRKRAQTERIHNPQKQIVSRHGRVPANDIGSVALIYGARVSRSCYGELMILVSGHDGLRTLDALNGLI